MNMTPTSVKLYKGNKIIEVIPWLQTYILWKPRISNHLWLTHVNSLKLIWQNHPYHLLNNRSCWPYLSTFFATDDDPLGQTSMVRHIIHVDIPPIHQSVRHQPVALQSTVVQRSRKYFSRESSSNLWSSPVEMVKRKDGAWQLCIDHYKLNEVMYCNVYHLPQVDATMDSWARGALFTTLDLASG